MARPTYASENFSTTLNVGGGISAIQTTGIILQSVSGLNSSGGILGFTWASALDSSLYEEIEYTGLSGNELTGVIRGVAGTSGKTHNNGATVINVVSSIHNNRMADKLRSVDAVLAQDTSDNEIIKTSFVASAVNETTVTNAATGNAPSVAATGGDTNIDLNLISKGTGRVKANAVNVPTVSSTDTLTNKRISKRVVVVTQSATPTINTDNGDIFQITGLAQAVTSFTTNLSGTPVAGDMIELQITDSGTARALTFGASFASTTVTLPTTTVISTMLRILFQRNNANTIWDCIATA